MQIFKLESKISKHRRQQAWPNICTVQVGPQTDIIPEGLKKIFFGFSVHSSRYSLDAEQS